MENGIYYGMDFDAYRSLPFLNCSKLKQLNKCPAAMTVQETSDAFAFGTACHSYIGENIMPVISPKFDKRTKDGKAGSEAFNARHAGKVIVTETEWELIEGMYSSVYAHPEAAQLYSKGRSEVTVIFEYAGVKCKARIDWLTPDNMLVDLKTAASATPHAFRGSCLSYGYGLQAAFYQCALDSVGITPKGFKFVAIEKAAPFMCNVFQLETEWVQAEMERVDWLIEKYLSIRKDLPLPAYTSPECITLAKPSYL